MSLINRLFGNETEGKDEGYCCEMEIEEVESEDN